MSAAQKKKKGLRACNVCDFRFPETSAQCPSCGIWNIPKNIADGSDQTVLLSEVSAKPIKRILTGPWDKCFGGPRREDEGIVTTSVNLIGGVPGAGKSTMALQLADQIAESTNREIVYVGAEESAEEIKYRAMRLQLGNMDKIRVHPMGSSVDLGGILISRKPSAIILDSLPGLISDPEQAVELCKRFKDYTVDLQCPALIIDHVTKEEDFAGLMALQHAVDALFILSRDEDTGLRELKTIKNRFGPANVSVYMEMKEKGLFYKNIMEMDDDDESECDQTEENKEDENAD